MKKDKKKRSVFELSWISSGDPAGREKHPERSGRRSCPFPDNLGGAMRGGIRGFRAEAEREKEDPPSGRNLLAVRLLQEGRRMRCMQDVSSPWRSNRRGSLSRRETKRTSAPPDADNSHSLGIAPVSGTKWRTNNFPKKGLLTLSPAKAGGRVSLRILKEAGIKGKSLIRSGSRKRRVCGPFPFGSERRRPASRGPRSRRGTLVPSSHPPA